MNATLLLRFDGPMQSWSTAGFADRPTLPFPTKSGIIGLLANAHGRKRSDTVTSVVTGHKGSYHYAVTVALEGGGLIVDDPEIIIDGD